VTEETGREFLPSATGFAARQAIAVLRRRNVPVEPLLARAGISEDDIHNRQGRISALAQGKLLEYAAEALGDSEFGLHLAEQATPREAGLLFYVASAAEHVGDALELAARYCRIGNEAVRLKVNRSSDNMIVETSFVGLPRHFAWQNTEFVIAATVRALREMAGQDFHPVQVTFTLARYSELREFERFFGCPVGFSARAPISSAFRTRPSPSRWSLKINICWKRFDPFARRRRRSAARFVGRYGRWSKMKCKSCCTMERPTGSEWRKRWG
jgi:AraC-type transcriptional regulator